MDCDQQYIIVKMFLDGDIHGSLRHTDSVLAGIEDVTTGRRSTWGWSGNAWDMTLSAKGAFFELNVLDDQPTLTLDFQTFKEALLDYRQFLVGLKKG